MWECERVISYRIPKINLFICPAILEHQNKQCFSIVDLNWRRTLEKVLGRLAARALR